MDEQDVAAAAEALLQKLDRSGAGVVTLSDFRAALDNGVLEVRMSMLTV